MSSTKCTWHPSQFLLCSIQEWYFLLYSSLFKRIYKQGQKKGPPPSNYTTLSCIVLAHSWVPERIWVTKRIQLQLGFLAECTTYVIIKNMVSQGCQLFLASSLDHNSRSSRVSSVPLSKHNVLNERGKKQQVFFFISLFI